MKIHAMILANAIVLSGAAAEAGQPAKTRETVLCERLATLICGRAANRATCEAYRAAIRKLDPRRKAVCCEKTLILVEDMFRFPQFQKLPHFSPGILVFFRDTIVPEPREGVAFADIIRKSRDKDRCH